MSEIACVECGACFESEVDYDAEIECPYRNQEKSGPDECEYD